MYTKKNSLQAIILQGVTKYISYSKRDLNPHSRNGQGILSPSCLPIPPFEHPLSGKRDSNSRPQPWQGCALPTELFPRIASERTGAKISSFDITAKLFRHIFFSQAVTSPSQQSFFGLLHRGEVEALDDLIHQLGDAVVAQIADAALVSVVHLLMRRKTSGFDVEPHLLVGVAEGHALARQAVDFLHAEDERVAVVVEDVVVHLDFVHDVGGHLQAVLQFLEGG